MKIKRSDGSHRFYYGWYILAASFIMLALNSSSQFIIGVMFKPIISDMGWSRSDISMAVLTNMAVFAIAMLFTGKAYDRYGPRWVIIVSVTLLGIGFAGISRMTSLLEFHLYYGLFSGIGFSGSTVLIFSSLISKWFEKRRGLAISIVLSGGRLGQFFLIPFYTDLIIGQGWKSTFLAIGIATFALNVLLAIFVVKGDPRQLGYQAMNGEADPVKPQAAGLDSPGLDLGFFDAARTRSYWIFVGVMMVCGAGDFFVATHLVPFVTDHGISAITGANMLAWLGLMSLVGVMIAGPASDRFGNKWLIAGTFVLRFFLILLVMLFKGKTVFYIFAIGFGFTLMITAVLCVTLVGKMYGFTNIGSLTGFVNTAHHLSGGILAYIGGAVFDRINNYQPVFMAYAFLSLAAVLATVFIREERHASRS